MQLSMIFACHVTRDFDRFRQRSALCNQSLQHAACRDKSAIGERLNLQIKQVLAVDGLFCGQTPTDHAPPSMTYARFIVIRNSRLVFTFRSRLVSSSMASTGFMSLSTRRSL